MKKTFQNKLPEIDLTGAFIKLGEFSKQLKPVSDLAQTLYDEKIKDNDFLKRWENITENTPCFGCIKDDQDGIGCGACIQAEREALEIYDECYKKAYKIINNEDIF